MCPLTISSRARNLEKNRLGEMSYAWTQDQWREGGTRDRPGATPFPGKNQLQAQEPTSIWEAGVMRRGLQGWASPGGLPAGGGRGLLPGPPADPELSVTQPRPSREGRRRGGAEGHTRYTKGFEGIWLQSCTSHFLESIGSEF